MEQKNCISVQEQVLQELNTWFKTKFVTQMSHAALSQWVASYGSDELKEAYFNEPIRCRHKQTLWVEQNFRVDIFGITDDTTGESYVLTWDIDEDEIEQIEKQLGFIRFVDSNRYPLGMILDDSMCYFCCDEVDAKEQMDWQNEEDDEYDEIAECEADPNATMSADEIYVP